MKDILISILRDKNSSISEFRSASQKLATELAIEAYSKLDKTQIDIQTPLAMAKGFKIKNNVVLVPILRSGLVLLPAFITYLPTALVGCVGLKRDEKTKIANLYYKNLPKITSSDDVIILDPMIASGGSACATLKILEQEGVKQEKMTFVGIISAQEGISQINKNFPNIKLIVAQHDKELSHDKFIIPGLGDFGDRFFGTL